ncbi:MAG: DinB family protein [Planctomycetota bacterium]
MNFDLQRTIEVLERTPVVLDSLLGGLSDPWVTNNYGEKTFSPYDVVGHLIHADRTNWMVRLHVILESGEAEPFPEFDRYAMYEASKGKTIRELLEAFSSLRAGKLKELRALNLTEELLDRRGIHPALGTATARQLLSTWVVHDLGHCHQIVKAMAFQYRDNVGPWAAYLTILPSQESA